MRNIDETILEDRLMPKAWECPHCGETNQTSQYADKIILEHLKYVEHCEQCGCLHFWKLSLTEKIKKDITNL